MNINLAFVDSLTRPILSVCVNDRGVKLRSELLDVIVWRELFEGELPFSFELDGTLKLDGFEAKVFGFKLFAAAFIWLV